jgi:hypothetical protein
MTFIKNEQKSIARRFEIIFHIIFICWSFICRLFNTKKNLFDIIVKLNAQEIEIKDLRKQFIFKNFRIRSTLSYVLVLVID